MLFFSLMSRVKGQGLRELCLMVVLLVTDNAAWDKFGTRKMEKCQQKAGKIGIKIFIKQ